MAVPERLLYIEVIVVSGPEFLAVLYSMWLLFGGGR